VAQHVRRDPLVQSGRGRGQVDGPVELPRRHMIGRVHAREQPPVGQDPALGVAQPPPGPQPFQQHRAEHGVAILAALALFHAQGHALAVDVGNLQRHDLADAQPGAVGHRHGRLVLQVRRCRDQPAHLLGTEDHGQLARHADMLHLGHHVWSLQRDVEEELQPRDGGVERHRTGAGVHKMQLKAPEIFSAGAVRRSAQECSQLANGADVAVLRVLGKLAHAHVVEHPMTQRRTWASDGLHGRLQSMNEADCLDHQHRRAAASTHHQRPGRSAYRASGYVLI